MRLITLSFIARFFALTVLFGVILAVCFALFLPRVYTAEVENGERLISIRAPQGGIVRSLSVAVGDYVRADTIVAEILTTAKQPPDASIARSILYKRVETALYESQRGGLRALLLKPDLRARIPLDKEYGRFVVKQQRSFSAFQSKLKSATQGLRDKQERLDIQVRGMEREIIDLSERRVLLQHAFARSPDGQLEAELRRGRQYLKEHNRQIKDLRRKARKNAKALLEKTLQIRREEGGGLDRARGELNALYEEIGLPANAFDRLGLTVASASGGAEQRLRRLIARKAGRVVFLSKGLRPGDIVISGEELVQVLPTASQTMYRFRYQKKNIKEDLAVKELSCHDFPNKICFQDNANIKGGVFFLPRKTLGRLDFPAPRAGSRCAVVLGFAGKFNDGVVLQRLANELRGLAHSLLEGDRLNGQLNSISDLIDLMNMLLPFIKFESKNFIIGDANTWAELTKISNELINYMNKAKNK